MAKYAAEAQELEALGELFTTGKRKTQETVANVGGIQKLDLRGLSVTAGEEKEQEKEAWEDMEAAAEPDYEPDNHDDGLDLPVQPLIDTLKRGAVGAAPIDSDDEVIDFKRPKAKPKAKPKAQPKPKAKPKKKAQAKAAAEAPPAKKARGGA